MFNISVEIDTTSGAKDVTPFVGWEDAELIFDTGVSFTPYAEFNNVKFFGTAKDLILQELDARGWTELIPTRVYLYDGSQQLQLMAGGIDGEKVILRDEEDFLECSIEIDDKNKFAYLISGKSIKSFGVAVGEQPVCVVSRDEWMGALTISLAFFVFGKTIYENIQKLQKLIADYIAHSTGGVTGPFAGAVWFAIQIALYVLYIAFITASMIKMIIEYVKLLKSRYQKVEKMNLWDILNKMVSFTGFALQIPKNIKDDLKRMYFIKPTPDMYGWEATEFLELIKLIFNVKIFAYNNTLYILHPIFSSNIYTDITYPPAKIPLFKDWKYNIEDLYGRFFVKQGIDEIDVYSVDAKHRFFEYIHSGFKRFNKIEIPLPAGVIKDDESLLEKVMLGFLKAFSNKQYKSFKNFIKTAIKVSDNNFISKLIYFENETTTKGLGEVFKYYYIDTMAHKGQKRKYLTTKIPFLIDYLKSNNFLFTINGNWTIDKFTWKVFKDYANVEISEEKIFNNKTWKSKIY